MLDIDLSVSTVLAREARGARGNRGTREAREAGCASNTFRHTTTHTDIITTEGRACSIKS
jgi:hypothetical protein